MPETGVKTSPRPELFLNLTPVSVTGSVTECIVHFRHSWAAYHVSLSETETVTEPETGARMRDNAGLGLGVLTQECGGLTPLFLRYWGIDRCEVWCIRRVSAQIL